MRSVHLLVGFALAFLLFACTQPDPGTRQFTLTVNTSGTGTVVSTPAGIDCGSDCSESYAAGTSVTLSAAPSGDFEGWSGDCSGSGDCVVVMDRDRAVSATFSGGDGALYTLTVTRLGTGEGAVTSNPPGIDCGGDCTEAYPAGTSVTLSPTPATGSDFGGWDGACSGTDCVVVMNGDQSVSASFSQADGELCDYGDETIEGNLSIASGASCTLDGTTVQGNILLGDGASLDANAITVGGNIQAEEGGGSIAVLDSMVGGDIQLMQGVSADVFLTFIGGNLQLESNSGNLNAEANTIDGDLQAFQNTGGVTITGNTIGGNLQCQGNNPAPTGGDNTVEGDKEGQCSGL